MSGKRERPRLGEAGPLNLEPVVGGTTLGVLVERYHWGGETASIDKESMHVNE